MPSAKTAFVSGRQCDKLVVFLHFHKAGGSSLIDYFSARGLWYDLRINSDPERYGNLLPGSDVVFQTPFSDNFDNMRVHSTKKTRVADPNFWTTLYDRGLDVVNLEYNFITPWNNAKVSSSMYKLTQIRRPWDRFRSTYER